MRRALITGGAKRLGASITRHLQAKGWQLAIHYNTSRVEADALADEVCGVAISADLHSLDSVSGLIADAASGLGGPITALINNASIFEHDHAGSITADSLEKHYRINTVAPALLARAFAEQAGREHDAVIVNLLDQKLDNLNPDFFSYTLSKAALETATQLMARSFAPQIRVCGVAPGYCLPAPGETTSAFERKAANINALKRRLFPEQVAEAVAFCLECSAITGQTILADNGEHLVPSDRDVSFKTDS